MKWRLSEGQKRKLRRDCEGISKSKEVIRSKGSGEKVESRYKEEDFITCFALHGMKDKNKFVAVISMEVRHSQVTSAQ